MNHKRRKYLKTFDEGKYFIQKHSSALITCTASSLSARQKRKKSLVQSEKEFMQSHL